MASTISLNVANFVTLKLTPDNYPLWREQMLALAESQDMVGLLTGETMKPAMYTDVTAEKTSTNNEEEKQISEVFSQMEKRRSSPTWMDHQDAYRRNFGSGHRS